MHFLTCLLLRLQYCLIDICYLLHNSHMEIFKRPLMCFIGFCGDWNPCCLSLCLNSCLTDTVEHIYRPHSWWLFCPLHLAEVLQSPGRKIAAGKDCGVSSEVKERFLSSCKGPPAVTIFLSYSLNQKRNLCFFSGSRHRVSSHPPAGHKIHILL